MRKTAGLIKALAATLMGSVTPSLFAADSAGQPPVAQMHYAQGTQQSFMGPEQYFTGDVEVEMLFPANQSAQYSGAYVTFQPSARTAWHMHPAGQHMIVISGMALTGTRDGNIIRFKPGETVWCPPNLDHWHGAASDGAMKHLVITGSKDGQNVIWKEKVSDEIYGGNSR